MNRTKTEQVAYDIVKRKIDQGVKFIAKGEAFANELVSNIYLAQNDKGVC